MPIPVIPERGRIIWAVIPDRRGGTSKLRPAVILTTKEEIAAGEPITVAVASTKIQIGRPEDQVELPWERQGRVVTKLRQRCVALCDWIEDIQEADIHDYAGVVPERQITAILTRVSELADEGDACAE